MAGGGEDRKEGLGLRRGLAGSPTVRAGGGVIVREGRDRTTEVLVVHRPRYDDWSFPKGKLEGSESELQCALREVQEETGLVCKPIRELSGTSYRDRRGRPKTVRYWSMRVLSGSFLPNSEVDVASWVDLQRAGTMLTYAHDLLLLQEILEEELAKSSALLVRHGTAGNRKDWVGDDRLRPLDEKGVRQAEALAGLLVNQPIKRIFSSPYLRCVQTMEPLAERLGLTIDRVDELAEGAAREDVEKLVRRAGGDLVVLCTHGDVIEWIVGPDSPNRKGGFWVLKQTEGRLSPNRYTPPPRTG